MTDRKELIAAIVDSEIANLRDMLSERLVPFIVKYDLLAPAMPDLVDLALAFYQQGQNDAHDHSTDILNMTRKECL